ncbi:hypothetical protein CRUP_014236 [Coryphaenoides rupestris]|nr:hypothetical protein CRUP_014236 [Coryphaenoides rupestris]
MQCEHQSADPLVWTSHRIMRWIREIDLKEYADNLQNSGVHGAVLVLDPTFNTDAMATALGIHSSKHMIRRHLVEEMQSLVGPIRASLQDYERQRMGTPPSVWRQGSLGRPPSSSGRHADDEGSLRRRAVKTCDSQPPTGFSPKARNGRDFSCHGSYGSLPREVCDEAPPRPEGSPIGGYTTIEVTNVRYLRPPETSWLHAKVC